VSASLHRAQSGVSLIEVLVAMAIVAMLISIALPSFNVYIQNTQIRTAAEAILNGLQSTKNEAIRRNAVHELTIHDGSAWDICPATDSYPCGTPVMSRDQNEGSKKAVVAITPADADTVAFNGLGRVVNNSAGTPSMVQIDITNPALPAAEARNMRIIIPPGGAIRMCDPLVAAGDPRAC
jgi:type IV fimbrial biogenesis protein FimT